MGYEYESCPDLILWEKRTAVLQGYEIDASKLGGWSLDKHHALNIQSGTFFGFDCSFIHASSLLATRLLWMALRIKAEVNYF